MLADTMAFLDPTGAGFVVDGSFGSASSAVVRSGLPSFVPKYYRTIV
jgi:hypothetical protein